MSEQPTSKTLATQIREWFKDCDPDSIGVQLALSAADELERRAEPPSSALVIKAGALILAEIKGNDMGDRSRGIYHKFDVTRTDGSSEPGGKHHGCFYFVLDLDHDPHAKAALQAYADSCRADYPKLADDLCNMVVERDFGNG